MQLKISASIATCLLSFSAVGILATTSIAITDWQLYAVVGIVALLCLHQYAVGYVTGSESTAHAARVAMREVLTRIQRDITTGQDATAAEAGDHKLH